MVKIKVIDLDGTENIYNCLEGESFVTGIGYRIKTEDGIEYHIHPNSVKRIEIYEGDKLCSKIEQKIHNKPRGTGAGCLGDFNPYLPTIEEIINGVFLHGRDTPNIIGRSELPKEQFTIANAIEFIDQHIKKGQSNV